MSIQKIMVKSDFARKANQEGGVSFKDAVQQAERAIAELEPEYGIWSRDYLVELDAVLGDVMIRDVFDKEKLDQAYDIVSRARNLGSTFEQPMVTEVSERFCELLYRMIDLEIFHAAATKSISDALKLVSSQPEFDKAPSEKFASFLGELDMVVNLFPPVGVPNAGSESQSQAVH